MIFTRRAFLGAAAATLGGVAFAKDALRVMTTTEDMASLTAEVGGDRVSVESIARGYQDPHFVEPKPSFILKLNRADLLVAVGLQLEIGWLPPLLAQSRNGKLQPGGQGYMEASQFAEILQKPPGAVSRALGDVHPLGNPHYWLSPENGHHIAQGIAAKLGELLPSDRTYFQQRFEDFSTRLTAAEKRWTDKLAPYAGRRVVTYHQSWPNFAKTFSIQVEGYIEPKPGIPPSPSHTLELINQMKQQGIRLIWVEPYFDTKVPNAVAQAVEGEAIVLMPSVGGRPEAADYLRLFDYDTELVSAAFSRLDNKPA